MFIGRECATNDHILYRFCNGFRQRVKVYEQIRHLRPRNYFHFECVFHPGATWPRPLPAHRPARLIFSPIQINLQGVHARPSVANKPFLTANLFLHSLRSDYELRLLTKKFVA